MKYLLALIILVACSNRPDWEDDNSVVDRGNLDDPRGKGHKKYSGLWVSHSGEYFRKLYRYDIDQKNWSRERTLFIESDIRLYPRDENSLYLMNRGWNNSLQILNYHEATVLEIPLTSNLNPQHVLEVDGMVYLVGHNRNRVYVIDDLAAGTYHTIKVKKVGDLKDGSAEFVKMLSLGNDRLLVLGQRLDRTNAWRPLEESVVVEINLAKEKVAAREFIPLKNPGQWYQLKNKRILIVGRGNLSAKVKIKKNHHSSLLWIDSEKFKVLDKKELSYNIVSSAMSSDEKLVTIDWFKDKKLNCVSVNFAPILCRSLDLRFSELKVAQDRIYLAVRRKHRPNRTRGELWILDFQGNHFIAETFDGPLTSLSFGP